MSKYDIKLGPTGENVGHVLVRPFPVAYAVPNQTPEKKDSSEVEGIIAKLGLPDEIAAIYKKADSIHRKLVLGDMTFYCPATLEIDNMKRIDLAARYVFMGLSFVLSWWPDVKLYTVRESGGANGYDQDEIYEKSQKRPDPKKFYDLDKSIKIMNGPSSKIDWGTIA